MDELKAISTFVRVAELGSFNRAAQLQGATPQAVSKTVQLLEQKLGTRLFHRTTRRCSLTEEGERLLETVKPNLEGLLSALASTAQAAGQDSGVVRVSAPRAIGRWMLLPLIVEYRKLHPAVEFEFILEDSSPDLVVARIDLAVRAGPPPDGQLAVRKLFPISMIPCASPAYLAARGVPRTIEDLLQHDCTGYRHADSGRLMPWEFNVGGTVQYVSAKVKFCANDAETELDAIKAGFGIGMVKSMLAIPELRAKRLVPLLVDHISSSSGLYLYYFQRADMARRVRNFINFCVARLADSHEQSIDFKELHALTPRVAARGSTRVPARASARK
jgi:DNA-binding transcriptional LysR family regulator